MVDFVRRCLFFGRTFSDSERPLQLASHGALSRPGRPAPTWQQFEDLPAPGTPRATSPEPPGHLLGRHLLSQAPSSSQTPGPQPGEALGGPTCSRSLRAGRGWHLAPRGSERPPLPSFCPHQPVASWPHAPPLPWPLTDLCPWSFSPFGPEIQ